MHLLYTSPSPDATVITRVVEEGIHDLFSQRRRHDISAASRTRRARAPGVSISHSISP